MKISHEVPKALFPMHNLISDYPYVLGHLLSLDKEYAEFYKRKLAESDFSILDNSCFELGKSIDLTELKNLAVEYKPRVLVLPDKLHDMEETLRMSIDFMQRYGNKVHGTMNGSTNTYLMGVLQGNNFEELDRCLEKYVQIGVKYIAIPFDCIKDSDWHTIRALYWKRLVNTTDFTYPMRGLKFHFLGITNPSELLLYTGEEKDKIYSIDTSSPIINGWVGNKYGEYGLFAPKPKDKLAENLDIQLKDSQIELIIHNVKKFKEYAR